MEDFIHKLTEKFSLDTICENFELSRETAVLSDEQMKEMLDRGQATRDIKVGNNAINNSEYVVQVGENMYVKSDNPRATGDNDKHFWVIYRPRRSRTKRVFGAGNSY